MGQQHPCHLVFWLGRTASRFQEQHADRKHKQRSASQPNTEHFCPPPCNPSHKKSYQPAFPTREGPGIIAFPKHDANHLGFLPVPLCRVPSPWRGPAPLWPAPPSSVTTTPAATTLNASSTVPEVATSLALSRSESAMGISLPLLLLLLAVAALPPALLRRSKTGLIKEFYAMKIALAGCSHPNDSLEVLLDASGWFRVHTASWEPC